VLRRVVFDADRAGGALASEKSKKLIVRSARVPRDAKTVDLRAYARLCVTVRTRRQLASGTAMHDRHARSASLRTT